MKKLFTFLTLIVISIIVNAQDTISLSDFKSIDNTNWKGNLTYKDYQSGKLETIPATMQLSINGDKIISTVQYVYEPDKNNTSRVKIRKNGTYFGNEKVISFRNENAIKILVTTFKGKDNGKKANMFITRELTDNKYTITKEVQYLGSEKRFMRNTYEYNKI